MLIKLKKTIVAQNSPNSKILVSVLKNTRRHIHSRFSDLKQKSIVIYSMLSTVQFILHAICCEKRSRVKWIALYSKLFTFLKLINPFISASLTISLLLFSISIWLFAFSESRVSFYGSFSLFIETLYRILILTHS